MKKLALKFLLLILPIIIFIFLINARYVSTNHWKAENNVWKFNFVPDDIQLANLGSSHGEVNFIYESFPQYKTFNFGISSQRYFWDYGILQQYIDSFAPNAVVLLPISYFGITTRLTNYDDLRPRYYRFLKKKYFDEWSILGFIRYANIPVLSAGKNIMKCFDDIPPENIDVFNSRTTYMTEDELQEYCVKKYESWTNPENEKGEEGYRQNLEDVCQLVKFCLDNGLQPVLVTTPITTVLNDIYEKDEDFFKTFYHFISDVQTQFPNVPYFDYSHDTEFSPKFELFADGDHLNVYGAREFTAHVVADLQEAGLLQ